MTLKTLYRAQGGLEGGGVWDRDPSAQHFQSPGCTTLLCRDNRRVLRMDIGQEEAVLHNNQRAEMCHLSPQIPSSEFQLASTLIQRCV